MERLLTVECDSVARADELEGPVRVPVASGRVSRHAVEEAVGDRDGVTGIEAKAVVLATSE
jgi:hypothetical protein